MRGLTNIILCLTICVTAQVKELNFLGKSWHLHAVEMRYGFPDIRLNNETTLVAEDQHLQQELITKYNKEKPAASTIYYPYTHSLGKTLALGAVFKPFQKSSSPLFQSVELGHTFGLVTQTFESFWDTIPNSVQPKPYGARNYSTNFYYNPSLNLSTPRFLKVLKGYGGMDARFDKPLSHEYFISKNSSQAVFIVDQNTINDDNRYELSIYSLPIRKIGIGYTLGLKMYLSCNFNLHIEFKDYIQQEKYLASKNTYNVQTTQILVGLRYKFAQLLEDTKANNKEHLKAFW